MAEILSVLPVAPTGIAAQPQPSGGSWTVPENRKRKGHSVGASIKINGRTVRTSASLVRWLTYAEMWILYRRVPDLRAAVDSIVRRIATWDWGIEPTVDMQDDAYEGLLGLAEAQRRFLAAPNQNGETWQEVITKWMTDLLVFDQGVIELVRNGNGDLAELVVLRGSTVQCEQDELGRITGYAQNTMSEDGGIGVGGSGEVDPIEFKPDEILFMRINPTTSGPDGNSFVEAIIDQCVTLLHSAEHILLSFSADEIPPGILLLAGITGQAEQRIKADFKNTSGNDDKLRILTTPNPTGIGAEWVEFRRTPKDLSMREIVNDIRRTIWRVYGVTPVEMGVTEGVPRATAEVQWEIGSSNLTGPLLELIEAKVNARILPMLAGDESLVGKTAFRFDRDAALTPEEKEAQARTLTSLVAAGLITRNEGRAELGYDPYRMTAEQLAEMMVADLLTVDGTPTELHVVLSADGEVDVVDPDDDDDEPPPDDGGDGGTDDGDDEAPGEADGGEIGDDEAPGEADAEEATKRKGHHEPHRRVAGDLPSDWQPEGRFRDVRTLDLGKLGEAIMEYSRAVTPMWHLARDEVNAAIGAAYADRDMTEDEAESVLRALNRAMDKLETNWRTATEPLYLRAAKVGRDAASDFTGDADAVEDYERSAELYAAQAMSFLMAESGPIKKTKRRIERLVEALTQRHQTTIEAPEIRAPFDELLANLEDEAVVAAAADLAFDVEEFRIGNWSGKLNDLSNQTLVEGLERVQEAEGIEGRVEWWAEWVYVGDDGSCETCTREGEAGIRPLSRIPVRPGGDTECRGRCRCVLVVWRKDEVDDGTAVSMSPTGG